MFKLVCCNCGNEMIYKQVDKEIKIENNTMYFYRDRNFGDKIIGCEKCGIEIADKI